MARPRSTEFTVNVRVARHGGLGDIPALLDMLRYEGGQVLNWGHPESDVLSVRIRTERFVPDRWRSFGIVPTEVTR